MSPVLRPLPATIAVIALLAGVKTFDLAHDFGIGSPARASSASPAPEAKGATPKPEAAAALRPPAEPKPAEPACGEPITDAERTALQDLRARRTEIEARGARLDEREAVLGAAEKRLSERVQQLTALQGKLEGLDAQRKEREEANWQGLVKMYEAMKPRDAAVIFNDLDQAVLIQVLDRMKTVKAAPILAAMTPDRARLATTQLAKFREQVSATPQLGAGAQ